MIMLVKGNLLDAPAQALVNAVNTVGVMGKGIALMFKKRFPENCKAYAAACARGEVRVGAMFVTEGVRLGGPRWIINFPTKKHWRDPSKLEWVRDGLVALIDVVRQRRIRSIAIPPLGCGNGGLDWEVVRPMIETSFSDLPEVEAMIFEPQAEFHQPNAIGVK